MKYPRRSLRLPALTESVVLGQRLTARGAYPPSFCSVRYKSSGPLRCEPGVAAARQLSRALPAARHRLVLAEPGCTGRWCLYRDDNPHDTGRSFLQRLAERGRPGHHMLDSAGTDPPVPRRSPRGTARRTPAGTTLGVRSLSSALRLFSVGYEVVLLSPRLPCERRIATGRARSLKRNIRFLLDFF